MKTNKQISSHQSCGIIAIECVVRQKTPPMIDEEKQKVAVTENKNQAKASKMSRSRWSETAH
jgi:hypothetical protein